MKQPSPELPSGVSPNTKSSLVTRLRGFLLDRFTAHGDDARSLSVAGQGDGSDAEGWYEEECEAEGPVGVCFLVLDRSASMGGEDKLGGAKRGAVEFWHEAAARGYATGLVVFDHEAQLLVAPGLDPQAFERALSRVNASGGTAMGKAMTIALEALRSVDASERAMVLFTDGQTSDREICLAAAKRARGKGIRIICRGTHDADRAFLARLASDAGLVETVADAAIAQTIASAARQLPAVSESAN